MRALLWNIGLSLVWATLTGDFSLSNLVAGFLIAYGLLWFASGTVGANSPYFGRMRIFLGFAWFFLKELWLANLRVALEVVSPRPNIRPGIVAVPLEVQSDAEITLLANLITLTPGTLSLDVSSDRSMLFVHAMYAEDPAAVRREIKEGFERKVMELMR